MNHYKNSHLDWLLDQVQEVIKLWKDDSALFDPAMGKLDREFERISKCPCREMGDE